MTSPSQATTQSPTGAELPPVAAALSQSNNSHSFASLATPKTASSTLQQSAAETIHHLVASLSQEQRVAILNNPFSEKSREILSPLPALETTINGKSVFQTIHHALGVGHQSLAHSPELHATWTRFSEKLVDGSVNPLAVGSPDKYYELLRSLCNAPTANETRAGPPFDNVICGLIETRSAMLSLCDKLGVEPPSSGRLPLLEQRAALQEILGGGFTLPPLGTIEFTPLGIVVLIPPESFAENRTPDVKGLNLRGQHLGELQGLVNLIGTHGYLDPGNLPASDRDIREHELRHALQYVASPRSQYTSSDFALDALDAIKHRELSGFAAFGRMQLIEERFTNSIRAHASEELASYLSGTNQHRPLLSSQTGLEALSEGITQLERVLWIATIPNDEKSMIFAAAQAEFEKVHWEVSRAQAAANLAQERGIDLTLIRSALEMSGLQELPRILECYGITDQEAQAHLSKRLVAAQGLFSASMEALRDTRHFLECEESIRPPWTEVYSSLVHATKENALFHGVVRENAARRNPIAEALMTGASASSVSFTTQDLAAFYGSIANGVNSASLWVAATNPVAALKELLPNIPTLAVTHGPLLEWLIDGAQEKLKILPSGSIPSSVLEALARETAVASAILSVSTKDMASPIATRSTRVLLSLANMREQLHKQASSGTSFEMLGGDTHLKDTLGEPPTDPSVEQLREIALHSPDMSPYWQHVERKHVEKLSTVDDLPHLFMIAQNTGRLDLAFTALKVANRLRDSLPQDHQQAFDEFYASRKQLLDVVFDVYRPFLATR